MNEYMVEVENNECPYCKEKLKEYSFADKKALGCKICNKLLLKPRRRDKRGK